MNEQQGNGLVGVAIAAVAIVAVPFAVGLLLASAVWAFAAGWDIIF